jgi:hypothetical protein
MNQTPSADKPTRARFTQFTHEMRSPLHATTSNGHVPIVARLIFLAFEFITNEIVPEDSGDEGAVSALNSLSNTTSKFPKIPMISVD